ncbi:MULTISPECIES: adenosine deaminase [unclassified Mesorhizobium]|uniref:adenosine deaminase n=1 Tax=unclassified Mesorhizobium TaxID=325217 RepID=UPI00112855D6|nr:MULTISPECIES: adenosine deaminase [unclassified Mesorhizobium]TPN43457.1 adenosine deaminase [Mesorhizobium sp. B1-1-9]TPN44181.1 adenosine deaminase [Mesorhizobium sp. B1-1-7]
MTDFIGLPKAEVHIHVEGCFEADDVISNCEEAGIPLRAARDRLFEAHDLKSFLEMLDWLCGTFRTREQLATTAYKFAQRMSRSGVRYADVIFNPTHWPHWHSNIAGMIDAFDAGFAAAEQDGHPPVGLCVSLLRTQSAAEAIELVELLSTIRHKRVVALSIDGNEAAAGRTGPRFAEAFRRAGAAGLRRTVHAGESSGPEGVRDAIELLGADRIDHGVRAIEDPELVELLVRRQIPLGTCPISNVALGVYPSLAGHPLDALRKAGVPVSINTDDPSLLDTTLEASYAACAEAFAWDDETIRHLAATSVHASYADPALKARILADLQAWRA